jgi:phage terminase large subunit-like protein
MVSMPRGNGKTGLASVLALYGLFADEVEGAQVLTVASDERRARHVFNACRRIIELDERLAERVQVFQDRIYVPHTDSTLAPLPAEPAALQGRDPTLAVVDELHVVGEATWKAMAWGKRDRSLTLAISTPAANTESVMWRLVTYGREHPNDSAFKLVEYAAPDGCEIDDEDAWAEANPALDDFLHADALRATLPQPASRRSAASASDSGSVRSTGGCPRDHGTRRRLFHNAAPAPTSLSSILRPSRRHRRIRARRVASDQARRCGSSSSRRAIVL